MTNQWLNHAVFYEIYPQSFCDSNGDGIGDIQGIISKLDYIEELGCNAIWMNPCFDSPFVDAGYDVRDYYKVAPRYGTNEDLKQLFKEAHQRNMHVILDLVPGHTSIESDWFKQSCKAEKVVFSALLQNVMATFLLYVIAISLMWLSLRKSKENSLRIERKKEQDYQRNLLEAAKKAEAANQAKTEFLQRMSHDIRTPINGIRGMVDVGDYYDDDLEKQSECRKKIREASNILLELVNEVLDMSKLESGEVFLEEKSFRLDEVIQEVCDVVERLAEEREIQVDMDLGPIQHMNLVGSAMHLKRLLMNVLSNAVKYNKDHGSIHLSCRELLSAQTETAVFEFTCKDSGIGMSEDFQKHIYEPFTQEEKFGASKFGGTGLGMPITKKLVEKMGGNITFESESGVGTTFVITIPFKINSEIDRCEDTQEFSLHALDGFNILLVEDNELNMEIAEFSLQNAGAKITKAWNGQEAVEIFQASSVGDFDVILMDVMMPVMDGYEATKTIRALSREDAKTIPIIAMTANAFSEDKIKAEEAGMNEHIAKPINMKLLIRIVSKLVNHT